MSEGIKVGFFPPEYIKALTKDVGEIPGSSDQYGRLRGSFQREVAVRAIDSALSIPDPSNKVEVFVRQMYDAEGKVFFRPLMLDPNNPKEVSFIKKIRSRIMRMDNVEINQLPFMLDVIVRSGIPTADDQVHASSDSFGGLNE